MANRISFSAITGGMANWIVSLAIGCLLCTSATGQQHGTFRTAMDDSTLMEQSDLTMMPYNRLIHSAGKVVSFGDPKLENHALDFSLLPDGRHLAVEDRYGVAVLDMRSGAIVHRWTFRESTEQAARGLMSTYCGIKSFVYEGQTYIVWGAGSSHSSALMIAEWNATGFGKVSSMPINAVPPAAAALPNDISVRTEDGQTYLYVVLNGNNQLLKIRFADRQVVWTA
ncbi:MAG TPA: phosphoesterase, partial [Puia sp.]|nr:phosphoesterase [Puia sp.]